MTGLSQSISSSRWVQTIKHSNFRIAEVIRNGQTGLPRLLIEIPHGATEIEDLRRAVCELSGPIPADLEEFFFVNTDFGAPELAEVILEAIPHAEVVILRSRIPRVLVDPNRVLDAETTGMTPAIPAYVAEERDRVLLRTWHAAYIQKATDLYEEVCGQGGYGLALHTYAPRSIAVDIDRDQIAGLRREYEPDRWTNWPLRPSADLITRSPKGELLAAPGLQSRLRKALEDAEIEVGENATYTLHPATWGARFAERYRGSTLALELRRDLLGKPWRPFAPSAVNFEEVKRLGRVLAGAIGEFLDSETRQ